MTSDLPAELVQALARAEALIQVQQWQNALLALKPFEQEMDDSPQALYSLAHCSSRLHDYESGRGLAVRARDCFQRREDGEGRLKAEILLGVISFEQGDHEGAHRHFLAALPVAEGLAHHGMHAMLCNNLGTIASLQDDPEQALGYYRQALALHERVGNTDGQAETLHNIGIRHRDLDAHDSAEEAFRRAAEAALLTKNQRLVAMTTTARAELALERGDVDGAERMARAALIRFDVHSSRFGRADAYRLLGMVARRRGRQEEALGLFDEALDLCGNHHGPLLEAETRLERSLLLRDMGDGQAARRDLVLAAATFRQLHARRQAVLADGLLDQLEDAA